MDRGGFIVARKVTHASEGDWKALSGMLEQLPISPESLAADTGYNDGRLRKHLKDLGIRAYIPIHPNQESSMVTKGDFGFRGDHLVCSEGKRLSRGTLVRKDRQYLYVARQKDCQKCPGSAECLPGGQKRRYISLSMFYPLFLEAREWNKSSTFRREMMIRQTTAEVCSHRRTVWVGQEADCAGFGRWTVKDTSRPWPTT